MISHGCIDPMLVPTFSLARFVEWDQLDIEIPCIPPLYINQNTINRAHPGLQNSKHERAELLVPPEFDITEVRGVLVTYQGTSCCGYVLNPRLVRRLVRDPDDCRLLPGCL